MDDDAALEACRTAGIATAVIGTVMVVAPGLAGRLSGVPDARTNRLIGFVDLSLAPGLLVGSPRWPWAAARTAANLATATVVLRSGTGWTARLTALALVGLTGVDGAAARRLRASSR